MDNFLAGKPSWVLLYLLVILISGCTTPSTSRYSINQDVAPQRLPTASEIKDISPKALNYSRGGNKAYTVRGISYQVLDSHIGYSKKGIASWYGSKFHGHLTSNGEIYDMYGLSAAHKSLPIPSFARVTNLDNNRQTIVRVNDRGPFHPQRLIDLSYGAAYKLGVLKSGTANVKIEAIDMTEKKVTAAIPSNQCTIQVVALTSKANTNNLLPQIISTYGQPAFIEQEAQVYRIKLGPFPHRRLCEQRHKNVLKNYPKAFIKFG